MTQNLVDVFSCFSRKHIYKAVFLLSKAYGLQVELSKWTTRPASGWPVKGSGQKGLEDKRAQKYL